MRAKSASRQVRVSLRISRRYGSRSAATLTTAVARPNSSLLNKSDVFVAGGNKDETRPSKISSRRNGPCRRCTDHAKPETSRDPSSFSSGIKPSATNSGAALTRRNKKRNHGRRSARKPGSYMRREQAVKIACRHELDSTNVVETIVMDS